MGGHQLGQYGQRLDGGIRGDSGNSPRNRNNLGVSVHGRNICCQMMELDVSLVLVVYVSGQSELSYVSITSAFDAMMIQVEPGVVVSYDHARQ